MLSFLTDDQILLNHGGFFAICQALKILNEKFQMRDSCLPAVVGKEFSIILPACIRTVELNLCLIPIIAFSFVLFFWFKRWCLLLCERQGTAYLKHVFLWKIKFLKFIYFVLWRLFWMFIFYLLLFFESLTKV